MTTIKLPVVGSTAATTAFCSAQLDGPGGLTLWLDGNGKITAGNGTLVAPSPNAFSLEAEAVSQAEGSAPMATHCPGSTRACRKSCYVHGLSAAQAATYTLYRHNSKTMRQILYGGPDGGPGGEEFPDEWAATMAEWITENAAGGFRWHVSGDVFSYEYAQWIAQVCRESPTVDHWIYTRSFDFLEPLAKVSTLRGGNLALNLSCDVDNYEAAREAALAHGDVPPADGFPGLGTQPLRLCYLTVDGKVPPDLDQDDVIFPDYQLRPKAVASLADSEFWQSLTQFQRGLVCPVDAHGKAENRRCGPCDRCLK